MFFCILQCPIVWWFFVTVIFSFVYNMAECMCPPVHIVLVSFISIKANWLQHHTTDLLQEPLIQNRFVWLIWKRHWSVFFFHFYMNDIYKWSRPVIKAMNRSFQPFFIRGKNTWNHKKISKNKIQNMTKAKWIQISYQGYNIIIIGASLLGFFI